MKIKILNGGENNMRDNWIICVTKSIYPGLIAFKFMYFYSSNNNFSGL